jgi:Tetracyclin repressor-like, C-terminal domain
LLARPARRRRAPGGDVSLAGMLRQFDKALGRALPELDPKERWRRLMFVTALLFQVSMLEPFMRELDEDFALGPQLETVRESMKRFAVAGLLAPAPAVQRRPKPRRVP